MSARNTLQTDVCFVLNISLLKDRRWRKSELNDLRSLMKTSLEVLRGVGLDLTISNLKALDQYTLYD